MSANPHKRRESGPSAEFRFVAKVCQLCARIADSTRFQAFIIAVILANAVVLGLQTYDAIEDEAGDLLATLDHVFLGVFVVEILIRILAYGPKLRGYRDFFREGWNVFDFVVIGAAFMPGLRENATLLRLIRLLRVVRIVSVLPDLRVLLRGMVRSLLPIATMGVVGVLLLYVYGMVGWILFHEGDPENWGDIGIAMLTLFQILTLENWPGYLEAGQEIAPASWIFFVSYVLIASFLVINILIAIIINSMEEVHDAERAEDRAELEEELATSDGSVADRLAEIRHSLDKLETQLAEGGDSSVAPPKSHGTRRPTKGGRMRA